MYRNSNVTQADIDALNPVLAPALLIVSLIQQAEQNASILANLLTV